MHYVHVNSKCAFRQVHEQLILKQQAQWLSFLHAEATQLDIYREQLDNAKNVPEQLHGDSYLRLTHVQSGLCLEFTALDALQAWRSEDRPPLRLGVAEQWLKSRQKDVQTSGAVRYDYDWLGFPTFDGFS